MTTKEKVTYIENYINNHYGEPFAEWLWEQTNHCTSDEQIAELYTLL